MMGVVAVLHFHSLFWMAPCAPTLVMLLRNPAVVGQTPVFSSTVTTTSTCVPVVIQDRDALLDPSPPLCVGHSCTNSWEQQGRNAFPSTMHPGNTGGRMCLALHQHGRQLSKGYGAEHKRNGI